MPMRELEPFSIVEINFFRTSFQAQLYSFWHPYKIYPKTHSKHVKTGLNKPTDRFEIVFMDGLVVTISLLWCLPFFTSTQLSGYESVIQAWASTEIRIVFEEMIFSLIWNMLYQYIWKVFHVVALHKDNEIADKAFERRTSPFLCWLL